MFFSTVFAGNIQVGQTVYGNNGSNLVGTVKAIYGEKAEILWRLENGVPHDFDKLFYWPCKLLSESVQCYKDLCNGDEVYANNGNELVGEVKNIFSNGIIEIEWTKLNGRDYDFYKVFYWKREQVTKKINSCKTCL